MVAELPFSSCKPYCDLQDSDLNEDADLLGWRSPGNGHSSQQSSGAPMQDNLGECKAPCKEQVLGRTRPCNLRPLIACPLSLAPRSC